MNAPPQDWQMPFQALAKECGLQTNISAVFENVLEFLEKVQADGMEM